MKRRGVDVKQGWRLCKSERLEAHLNSGCVSPALAECYLLQHGNSERESGELQLQPPHTLTHKHEHAQSQQECKE